MARPKKETAAGAVIARVLAAFALNGVAIPAGAVITLSPADAAARKDLGDVDQHPDAVAYARSQGAPEIDLTGGE